MSVTAIVGTFRQSAVQTRRDDRQDAVYQKVLPKGVSMAVRSEDRGRPFRKLSAPSRDLGLSGRRTATPARPASPRPLQQPKSPLPWKQNSDSGVFASSSNLLFGIHPGRLRAETPHSRLCRSAKLPLPPAEPPTHMIGKPVVITKLSAKSVPPYLRVATLNEWRLLVPNNNLLQRILAPKSLDATDTTNLTILRFQVQTRYFRRGFDWQ